VSTPGLEVLKDGLWVPIPAIPHAFVINIGDQIQVGPTSTNYPWQCHYLACILEFKLELMWVILIFGGGGCR
jgi:hypothetical protein